MLRNPVSYFVALALISSALVVARPVIGAAQVIHTQADQDARRAAEDLEFGEARARYDDRQEILDAQEQARQDAQLSEEESQRERNAADANQRRAERKARLKALIEK